MDVVDRRVVKLCRLLRANPAERLGLQAMAAQVDLSASHLQRRFTRLVGVSPREFHEACRLEVFKGGLRSGESVARALHTAGYSSPSRMHARTSRDLGMTPGEYRRGARHLEITHAHASTPLGRILIGATDRGLCHLSFGASVRGLRETLAAEFPGARLAPMPADAAPVLAAWLEPLLGHLAGEPRQLTLPLDLRGTAFQLQVWRYLQQIPSGETRTYSEVAQALGRPSAVRAVASACARNQVAVLVPCHRVLRADGNLAGYRWGLPRKRALLAAERRGGVSTSPPT